MSEQYAYECEVREPEQRIGSGLVDLSYWVYVLRSVKRVVAPFQQDVKECDVERRYNDFLWFRNCLCSEFPYCIIPPIPEKDTSGTIEKLTSTKPQLHCYRQRAFQKFLTRIFAHPLLKSSSAIDHFLFDDRAAWEVFTKTPLRGAGDEGLMAIVGSVADAIGRQWNPTPTGEIAGDSYSAVLQSSTPLPPSTWAEARIYIKRIGQALHALREQILTVAAKRRKAGAALVTFHQLFSHVADLERKIPGDGARDDARPEKLSNDAQEGTSQLSLADTIGAVSSKVGAVGEMYVNQGLEEETEVVEAITYYILLYVAAQEAIKRFIGRITKRDACKARVEALAQQQQKLVMNIGSPEKLARVRFDQVQAEKTLEEEEHMLGQAEETMRNEIRRFHVEQQYDIKTVMRVLIGIQARYGNDAKESLAQLEPIFKHK